MVLNWGATPLSGTLVGSTTFTFTIPANLIETVGPVSLTVTTAGGTSTPVTFTVTQPPPTITSISPASVPAGSAAFTMTVNGTNFVKGMNTRWGSTWVGANIVSSTQLWVTIPASLIASAGTAGVMVYTSGGISVSRPFTITPRAGYDEFESQFGNCRWCGIHVEHYRDSHHPNHQRDLGHDPLWILSM